MRAEVLVGTREVGPPHCYLGHSLGRWQKSQVVLWDLRAERTGRSPQISSWRGSNV